MLERRKKESPGLFRGFENALTWSYVRVKEYNGPANKFKEFNKPPYPLGCKQQVILLVTRVHSSGVTIYKCIISLSLNYKYSI